MKQLPKTLYATWCDLPNDDPYLKADVTPGDCLEDDGPITVGTYKLVDVRTVRKVLEVRDGR